MKIHQESTETLKLERDLNNVGSPHSTTYTSACEKTTPYSVLTAIFCADHSRHINNTLETKR